MKTNDMVVVTIEDIGINGEGIGKVDGYTLFIKDAVIGDKIEAKITKAKKNYGYARLMKVLEPSHNRVEAKCLVARQCGGCQIQELSYEKQLSFKDKKVRDNLKRIGGFCNRQRRTYCDRILCRTDTSDYSKHRVCSWSKTEQRNFGNDCGFHEYTSHYNI